MNDLVSILSNAGSTVVLIAYLIYRDKVFISRLTDTLTRVEAYLGIMAKKEGETITKTYNEEKYIHDLISDRKVM